MGNRPKNQNPNGNSDRKKIILLALKLRELWAVHGHASTDFRYV